MFLTVKKYFQDLLSQHFFVCQINLNNLFSSDNLLFWVSNNLKVTYFFKLNQQYFLTVYSVYLNCRE